jgi:hypothetical protein
VLIVGAHERIEACGMFALISQLVPSIGDLVAPLRVSDDHAGLFDAGVSARLVRSSTNLTFVERSLALVRDTVTLISLQVATNPTGFILAFGAKLIRTHAIRLHGFLRLDDRTRR